MSTTDNDYDSDVTADSNDSGAGAAAPKDSNSDSGHSSDGNTGTTATSNTDQGTDDGSNVSSDEEDTDDGGADDGQSNIVWSGPRKATPILTFRPECMYTKIRRLYSTGEKYHLAYKMVRTECKVIRQLLHKHGFREVHPNSSDFNLTWIGCHVKPYTLRSLTEFQKINHFPRSYEITRKDRLYKNFQRMQHSKGYKHFDFLPQSFCIPSEFEDFNSAHLKERGTWIVKPVASSRGRGIFLINHPQNLPLDDNFIVSRYLSNPLTIDGFKFDCRLYVAVTSYDPLRAYIYEEGLARFATVQYNPTNRSIKNQCMHLTNYSINKKSQDFVKCSDPSVEDYGNKWSLGAMLRYIKKQGRDIKTLIQRIEDVIIKTLLCAEMPVATACKMFMPHRGNCFELYGFDILIDEKLKPWVLEVNLSPSLACDAPIDMKIKSNMIGDLFSLIGFMAQDPMMRKVQSKRNQELASTNILRQQKERIGSGLRRQRPQSAGNSSVKSAGSRPGSGKKPKEPGGLTAEERRILIESKDEYQRRGGWMRLFPSAMSMDRYGSFLESRTTHNQMLHSRLYPDNLSDNTPSTTPSFVSRHAYTKSFTKVSHSYLHDLAEREISEHMAQWLRKLTTKDNSEERKILRTKVRQKHPAVKRMLGHAKSAPPKSMSIPREPLLAQGQLHIQNGENKPPPPSSQQSSQESLPSQQGQTAAEAKSHHQRQSLSTSASQSATEAQSRTSSAATQRPLSGRQRQASTYQVRTGTTIATTSSGKPPSGPASTTPRRGHESGDAKTVRMVLEVQRGPSKQEIRESINVPEIMDHGGDLSKLQARGAFATYLLRVQQRLLEETSRSAEKVDEVTQNDEQMDLVLRFLRRAAGNLQQPFKVIVPSRKLPMHDRRRILAKQLADFVSIYSKETEQLDLRQKMDRKLGHQHSKHDADSEVIEEDRFSQFMTVANESELEELLTIYTKQNKSASIFLGTSTAQPKSINNITSQPASIHHSQSADNLLQRRTSSGEVNRTAAESNPKEGDIYNSNAISSTNLSIPHKRPQSTPNSDAAARYATSSYESAVPLYSAKMNRRPTSAKPSFGEGGDGHGHGSRPTSAVVYRDSSGGQIASRHFSESSHQAIQEALQRLAKRQAARQYSANSNQNKNLLTQQALQQHNQELNNNASSFGGPLQANHAVGMKSTLGASHSMNNLQSGGRHTRGRTWDGQTRTRSSSNLASNMQGNHNQASNSGAQLKRTSSQEHLKQTNIVNNTEPPNRGHWVQPASSQSSLSSTNSNNARYEPKPMDSVQDAWLQSLNSQQQQQPAAAPSSAQFQYVLQQQQANGKVAVGRSVAQQQRLQEQKQISYDMTQQSKAKHQEKIAQAHSSATALREALQRSAAAASATNSHSSVMLSSSSRAHSAASSKSVKPRPPPNSAHSRKPISTQRLARTTQEAQGPTFYSGVKYNNMTGYSRPSYNSGSLQATVIRH